MSRTLGFNFFTVSEQGMCKFMRTSKTGRDICDELPTNHIVLYVTSVQPVFVVGQNERDKPVLGEPAVEPNVVLVHLHWARNESQFKNTVSHTISTSSGAPKRHAKRGHLTWSLGDLNG
jgi:hypothetical protein